VAVTVTNLSRDMMLIRLRSGETIHLHAGEVTAELPDAEIVGNPRVDVLIERHQVAVKEVAAPAKGRPQPSRSAKSDSGES
jgi:hypothetical protein